MSRLSSGRCRNLRTVYLMLLVPFYLYWQGFEYIYLELCCGLKEIRA